jgi:MAF protein
MSKPHLLLASQSPRRHELLALLELSFEVTVADVAEAPQVDEPPAAVVARLSQDKARAAVAHPTATTVACDTIVALDGDILGKPQDEAEATAMLRRLRALPHTVYSAITLLDAANDREQTETAMTQVAMRAYTDAEIVAYVASGDPLDKAGSYAIQHAGFHPVADLRGCYANVMGLPLCHLTRCLRTWGIEPLANVPAACQTLTSHRCEVHTTILNDQ